MVSLVGWQPSELWAPGVTLKQLTIVYDARLLDSWDHTSTVGALIHNLTTIVIGAVSKRSSIKPKSMTDMHPFRTTKRRGLVITKDNFQVLRTLGNAIVGGKRK